MPRNFVLEAASRALLCRSLLAAYSVGIEGHDQWVNMTAQFPNKHNLVSNATYLKLVWDPTTPMHSRQNLE